MALSISDLTPEGRRYFEQLQKLSRLEVQVGFQEGQTYEDGTSLADVAAYNELGTSDSPARRKGPKGFGRLLQGPCAAGDRRWRFRGE